MPISIQDNIKKVNEYFTKNLFLKYIFSNIIILSLLIITFNIIIFYYNLTYEEEINLIKISIWSFLFTTIILLLHNKNIKLHYLEQTKQDGSEEFKTMMENNTNNLIEKNINGKNEIESDIIKFLDR